MSEMRKNQEAQKSAVRRRVYLTLQLPLRISTTYSYIELTLCECVSKKITFIFWGQPVEFDLHIPHDRFEHKPSVKTL